MTGICGYRVVSVGSGALDIFEMLERRGEVRAVYTNSCYLWFPEDRLVCVGSLDLDDGPLTVRVAFPAGQNLDILGIGTGASVRRTLHGLRLEDEVWLDMSDAACWSPPKIEGYAEFTVIEHRINSLGKLLETIAPDAGLAPLIGRAASLANRETSLTNSQLVRTASLGVTQLVHGMWSSNGTEMDRGIASLVGLGPGLTPSGDDLLGGMMIGMWAMAGTRPDLEGTLTRMEKTIHRIARSQTTVVSSALLGQAAIGIGTASVHSLVQILIQSNCALDPLEEALRVSNAGHTSGWDCLAGLLIGIHFGLQVGKVSAPISNNSRLGNIYAD